MHDSRTHDGIDDPPTAPRDDGHHLYTAELIVSRDDPAECIIFEEGAEGLARLTTWVTAREGSFVSLEEMQ